MNAPSGATLILRNLSIDGAGAGTNGIRVISAGQVHVERCTIQNFLNNGIQFGASGDLFVTDTTIKQVVDQAIYVQSGRASLDRVATNGSGIGVLVGPTGRATVKNSVASGNEVGFAAAYSAAAQLNLEDSVTTNNLYGVLAINGASVRMSNVNVTNNSTIDLYNDGTGIIASFGNNRFAGNGATGSFTSMIVLR